MILRILKLISPIAIIFLSGMLLTINSMTFFSSAYAQGDEFRQREFSDSGEPEIVDRNLKIEEVASGLDTPTTMAFLGPNDILVLEKDKGTIKRILDGKILDQPILDVNVANSVERCMCGIAISKHEATTYVFLYYTEINGADGEDRQGKQPIGNRLYRFELVDNVLKNPIILLDLPALPGPRHNGGAILIGPDENIYVPIGDVDGSFRGEDSQTLTQNYHDGVEADGRSGILRITQEGQPVGEGIIGNEIPLRLYYAYGIRNSFGLGFDPLTGKLWDTENGPGSSDEINLVEPGFNSGWQETMGISKLDDEFDESELVDFDGKGHYRDPELVWLNTAGPTAVVFMTSDKLGTQYLNQMFVADVHNGRIYHFGLTEDRMHLVLPPALQDKIIRSVNAPGLEQIIFGQEFGGITDLKIGPDGYLYIVSVGLGKIFRIAPA